jgi:hypothetical protein
VRPCRAAPAAQIPFHFTESVPLTDSETLPASCDANIRSIARAASSSSSPLASMSMTDPIVAHNERMLKILRKSATLPLHFRKIVERNRSLNRTKLAAGRRCNPLCQETTTLLCFIIGDSTDSRRLQFKLPARKKICGGWPVVRSQWSYRLSLFLLSDLRPLASAVKMIGERDRPGRRLQRLFANLSLRLGINFPALISVFSFPNFSFCLAPSSVL